MNFIIHNKFYIYAAIIGSLLLYFPTLSIGFLSDDWGYVYLAQNTSFFESFNFLYSPDQLGNGSGNYRPIQSIMTVLVWGTFYHSPWILHLISIILHGIISFMVGYLALYIFKKKNLAFVASFAFLTLPLNTEAVVWLASWNTLLATIPLLYALILYTKKQPSNIKNYIFIILPLIISLLAKEHALVFPAFILGIDLLCERKPHIKTIILSTLIIGLYFFARIYVLGNLGGYNTLEGNSTHFDISFYGILLYMKLPLMYIYNFFNSTAVPYVLGAITQILSIILITFSAGYIIYKKETRIATITHIFILGLLLYTAHLMGWNLVDPLDQHTQHSRILYTSSMWFVMLLGYVYEKIKKTRLKSLFIIYLLLLPILAIYQLHPWIIAGQESTKIQNQIELLLKNFSPGDTLHVYNLPDQYNGGFIFRNGIEFFIALQTNTLKNEIPIKKTIQMSIDKPVMITLE